jgi:hypothetical protein
MNNIVEFKPRKAKVKASNKGKFEPMTMKDVDNWVEENIQNLMQATGKTHAEAVQMASDFYYKYPALMEFVRSPEHMASRK